jgi:hypothetical protein
MGTIGGLSRLQEQTFWLHNILFICVPETLSISQELLSMEFVAVSVFFLNLCLLTTQYRLPLRKLYLQGFQAVLRQALYPFVSRSIGSPIILDRCPSENESMLQTYLVCREKQEREGERERDKQTARGRSTQYTNNSNPITSKSELLLRQSSVTAHESESMLRTYLVCREKRERERETWEKHAVY